MSNNGSEIAVGKEIRFAVVMYGGVSLAIYINGIAQELLKMCRATPKFQPDYVLESTEKIYRKIAYLLDNKQLLERVVGLLEADQLTEAEDELQRSLAKNQLPRTRFVVDILTGTSAGGINAVFLAKALSNNQNIKQLKELWLNEGDISVLINDKLSVKDVDLPATDKTNSLLNSNRMYLKLLEAFEGMDENKSAVYTESLFVEELDLFVPTTDFRGTIVPLRLFDTRVEEKRFKQVFHFQYDNNVRNDFEPVNNPMLAVAARSTSSFPFAFEPMRVGNAYEVIKKRFPETPKMNKRLDLENSYPEFFPKIVDKHGNKIDWLNRDLVDGGVLDNKPFGHAISVLSERKADLMVTRKLLYVEPSPEIFKNDNNEKKDAPDVLENAIASLSSIPSYETIREDLERLLERNRLIERVTALIKNAEKDVFEYLVSDVVHEGHFPESKKSGEVWEELGLEDIVREKGRAVLSYYRLRIVSLTDEIARLVTQSLGVDENSEYFAVIRNLVWAWRKSEFSDYKKSEKGKRKKTSLFFLRGYDLHYRLRRLRFVLLKAGQLYYLNEDRDFSDELHSRGRMFENIRKKNVETEKSGESAFVEEDIRVSKKFLEKINAAGVEKKSKDGFTFLKPSEILSRVIKADGAPNKPAGENYFNQINLAVKYFQEELNKVFRELQKKNKALLEPNGKLVNHLKEIQSDKQLLENLLKSNERQINLDGRNVNSDDENLTEIENKNPELFSKIRETAGALLKENNEFFEGSRKTVKNIFNTALKDLPEDKHLGLQQVEEEIFDAVRGYLKNYYDNFDEYDQISFPIYYQTEVGEAVKVDVMRISPNDATLLDPENKKRQKLAGESLFHFGAFLDRTWRWNDIFWGRLDGAERLIAALLPGQQYEKLRIFLSRQAHDAIIEEELVENNKNELRQLFGTALVNASTGMEIREVLGKLTNLVTDDIVKRRLNAALQNCLRDPEKPDSNAKVYEFVKNQYEFEKRLEPKSLLRVISRSTKVVGDIFEGIADDKAEAGGHMRWIARFGQIFWGLVEVAAPNSFLNMLALHLLKLIYAFEVVLIIGSTIFNQAAVQQFGIVALVLTLITHLTAVTLNDYMRGNNLWRWFKVLALTLMVILSLSGVVFFLAFFFQNDLWEKLVEGQKYLSGFSRLQRLLPISLVVALFVSIFIWRKSVSLDIGYFGKISIIYVVLAVIISAVFGLITQHAPPEVNPVLALEFVRSNGEVSALLGQSKELVRELKLVLFLDSFIFIPLYVGFLLFFSSLLKLWRGEWVKYVIRGLTIGIIGAGLADFTENFFSYLILDRYPAEVSQWIIDTVYYSAVVKWSLLSLITMGFSLIFWRSIKEEK
jgi:patatin-related protein